MLPILQLSSLYSDEKIKEKYPCLVGDSKLIKNLFFEFLKNVYRRESFYTLLYDSYYESNAVILAWQEGENVPTNGEFIREYFENKIWVSEKSYWISACSADVATNIFLDLAPLWGSLLAQKIENEQMSESDYFTYMEDMYVFEETKSTEILRYPYRVSMEPEGYDSSGAASDGESSADSFSSASRKKNKRSSRSYWILLLIIAILVSLGYYFFQSGYFQRFPSPYGDTKVKNTPKSLASTNIQLDSIGKDSLRLNSVSADTSILLTGETAKTMQSLLRYDSVKIEAYDSTSHLSQLLSLPILDEGLYYEISMSPETYTKFKKEYPDLKFIYINEPKDFKYIILKIKHN